MTGQPPSPDSARWERVARVFEEAVVLPAIEQDAFVRQACGGDDRLAGEVLAMLQRDSDSHGILDRGLAGLARRALGPAEPAGARDFGPYRTIRVLGEGGMGVVYLAERKDLGSQVCIKVLRDAWLSPARRDRFESEQRTLAQLHHPSIARLYDAAVLPDGTPYFVMEYVEGLPLIEYCRHNRLPAHGRLRLFRGVCEAVQYAHSQAVIHRDLKPSNILVKNGGDVRLLDFGIAKHIESLDLGSDPTRTGLRMMTPAYAAPEQIRGERVGIGTDVYSLGVILYQMLTNELPFDLTNLTPAEAASVIAEHSPGKPSAAARRNPDGGDAPPSKLEWADLDVLCLGAMHKDPQRRYRSVEALIRDIDHYLAGEPLEARPDTLGYRTRKFLRRHARAMTAAGLSAAIFLAMGVFFTVRLARTRDRAMAEAARAQRIQQFMVDLLRGGDPAAGPSDSLRVVTLLDRGVQQAQSLRTEPEAQAELYATLGTLYQNLGKFDRADSLLTSALEARKARSGADSVPVAESLVALGLLRDDQANLPEAERLIRQGLAVEQRRLAPNHPAIGKAMTALGKVLEDRGAYPAAIQTLNDAVRLEQAAGAETPAFAGALYELANCQFYAGHYNQAESLNQRLLPIARRIYGDRHPRVADVLTNLGAIRHDRGRYPEAEQFERQALDMVRNWYGEDSPETASDLTMLARTLVYEHRFDEAASLLRRSLDIKERVYGAVHPSVASSLNELGNSAMLHGDYDAAEQYFTRMLSIYLAVYGNRHYLVGIAMSNLAGAQAHKGQWKRAEALFRQVVQLFTETQGAGRINTGIARVKLGGVLLKERQYRAAETESHAGYDVLVTQMAPDASWLTSARKDLVEEYDALHEPEAAGQFRAELAAHEQK